MNNRLERYNRGGALVEVVEHNNRPRVFVQSKAFVEALLRTAHDGGRVVVSFTDTPKEKGRSHAGPCVVHPR